MGLTSWPKVQKIRFVWGNWRYHAGRFYFSGLRKAPDVQIFSGASFATNAVPVKNEEESSSSGNENKYYLNFRENDYNSAVNTHF